MSLLKNNTPLYYNKEGFNKLNTFLKETHFSSVFVLVDNNTLKHCFPILKKNLDISFQLIEIQSGEIYKNLETCSSIWQELTSKGADRKSILINLGGGVITDIGGFAAASFKRGIAFINIPTTLLGMVDAGIGGKTGVDFNGLKNQIGLFINPKLILIHPDFIETLEQREVLSGLAEIIKYGLINNQSIWNFIEEDHYKTSQITSQLIEKSIAIKEQIVKSDPYEKGIRKTLNFGHTLGHAIETHFFSKPTKEQLLHGEAVAIGMILAVFLSHKLTNFNYDDTQKIAITIKNIYSQQIPSIINQKDITLVINLLKHDKKNDGKKTNFILLSSIGEPVIDCEVSQSQIIKAFDFYNTL
jgi:3-dehydroquinate synthase